MRSCDADTGSRPMPCPVFWLSPDLRVAPLANLGMPTQTLTAGDHVPLHRDRPQPRRPAGAVGEGRVLPREPVARLRHALRDQARRRRRPRAGVRRERDLDRLHGAAVARAGTAACSRACSRSRRSTCRSTTSRSTRVLDRHIAQLNLNIVANGAQAAARLDPPAATRRERLELVPMTAPMIRALRLEAVTALTIVSGTLWRRVAGQVEFDVQPAKGPRIAVERTGEGLELSSHDPEAVGPRAPGRSSTSASSRRCARSRPAARTHDKHAELFRELRGDEHAGRADAGHARVAAGRAQARPGAGPQRDPPQPRDRRGAGRDRDC